LSRADGFLATLIKAEDTVWLSLQGNGPLSEWQGEIETEMGAYGALGGEISGDLQSFQAAGLRVRVLPGTKLPELVTDLGGEAVDVTISIAQENNQPYRIQIDQLRGDFGAVEGGATVDVAENLRITANLNANLTDKALDRLGATGLPGDITLISEIQQQEEVLTLEGVMKTPIGQLELIEGRSRPSLPFAGKLIADIRQFPKDIAARSPLLEKGGRLSVDLRYDDGQTITANNVNAYLGTQGKRIQLSGDGWVDLENETIETEAMVTLDKQPLATLLGQDVFQKSATISIKADGPLTNITADLTAKYPQSMWQEKPIAAGQLRASLTGLPNTPAGTAQLRSADNSYRGEAELRRRGEVLTLQTLTFNSSDLTLQASGQHRLGTKLADLDFNLNASEPTTLITGQMIYGNLTATLAQDEGVLTGKLIADNFAVNGNSLRQAELNTLGPLKDLQFDLIFQDADLPGVYLATGDVKGKAKLIGDDRSVTINNLMTTVGVDEDDQRITLLSPMTIGFGENISISETRLDWLKDGIITAQADLSSQRWTANLQGENITAPGVTAPVTLQLDLDTNNEELAQFNIIATTSPPEEEDIVYNLSLQGDWDGSAVNGRARIVEGSRPPILEGAVAYPLVLDRSDGKLSLTFPQTDITGRLNAQGPVEAVQAFLPDLPLLLNGQIEGSAQFRGRPETPEIDGEFRLSDGRFEENTVGLALADVSARLKGRYTTEGTVATLDMNASGVDGRQDAVRLNTNINIRGDQSDIQGDLVLEKAMLADNPELELVTSGQLSLNGSIQELLLAGDINIDTFDAQIPSSTGGRNGNTKTYTPVDVRPINAAEENTPLEDQTIAPQKNIINLDVNIQANNRLFVRGRGLTSEWGTDLNIQGQVSDPIIRGQINNRQGVFQFAGRDFEIIEGRAVFDKDNPTIPYINVSAAYEASDITAV
ncbi:MAG: translocation/assembly module TamB domain-containing protein, partial [Pseudomonadota bacterium]